MNGSISRNSNNVAYGVKHYTIDTPNDVKELPLHCTPGSTAFVISTSDRYMFNNQYQWIKVANSNSSGGSGSGEGQGSGDGCNCHCGDIDSIIWDGGNIDNGYSDDDSIKDIHVIYDGGVEI